MSARDPGGEEVAGAPRPSGPGAAAREHDDEEHDRRRRRVPVRMLLVGAGLSLVVSLGLGVAGVPGSLAGAAFLSLLALTSAVAGSVLAIGVVVDQFRGRHVSGRRVLLTGGSVLLTLVLLIASAGAVVGAAERLS